MSERLLGNQASPDERQFEASLRPRRMSEYLGQSRAKGHLEVFVKAAVQRGEALDHVLLFGPPGLGKTTLAHVIAQELGSSLRITSGPAIDKAGDLAAILTNLEKHDVFFIDEIHRLTPSVEEILYSAMEDHTLDIIIGAGPSARNVRIDLQPFTLIGATTRASLLSSPLRSRFGIIERLDYYSTEELTAIVQRSAKVLGIALESGGAVAISDRSRGTPRIANRLLRRVRDFAQVEEAPSISDDIALHALDRLEVDALGLDEMDRRLLTILIQKFTGGPTGLSTLAAALGEDKGAIEEIIEPYLIQHGMLERSPRGRLATRLAVEHLGLRLDRSQRNLF